MNDARRVPVVLVGLMGCGKSTVGRLLAVRTARRFVDLDEAIEDRTGIPVSEIFRRSGEAGFRDLEAAESAQVASGERDAAGLIVATGGGWMVNAAARAALPDATIVWLRVGPAEAARRLLGDGGRRPMLGGADPESRLGQILAERLPAYGEATYTVDTEGRSPDQVAGEIQRLLDARRESNETRTGTN